MKKDRHALAHSGISDVVLDSYRNTSLKDNDSFPVIKSSTGKDEDITSNHASMDTETSDTPDCLPTPLSSQCSQQASSEVVKENNRNAISKNKKTKIFAS